MSKDRRKPRCAFASAIGAAGVAWAVSWVAMLALWVAGAKAVAGPVNQPTVSPPGASDSFFHSVSCESSTSCTAVGGSGFNVDRGTTLIEHWNGRNWSIQPTPASALRMSSLNAVSCAMVTTCTAVGSTLGRRWSVNLAEGWDGISWSGQRIPTPPGANGSELDGVSCVSTSACIAIGIFANRSGTYLMLAGRWNGSVWSIERLVTPPGARPVDANGFAERDELGGVSCVSATRCTAVGHFTGPAGTAVTLVERWDGKRWSIQPTPSLPRKGDSDLNAVSCVSPTVCTAVGDSSNKAGAMVTLAERWDGRRWSIQRTPSPTHKTGSELALDGVSCASPTACTAVGTITPETGGSVSFVERWDGWHWSIQRSPLSARTVASNLDGVSCVLPRACTAVGSLTTRSGTVLPLAERYP